MKIETFNRLNDIELIRIREFHFQKLSDLYAGKPLENVFFLYGINGYSPTNEYLEPERWVDESLEMLASISEKSLNTVVFKPLVLQTSPYGVHFVDRIFGANVYTHGDQWWADFLETPIGELEYPDLSENHTWQLAVRMANAFLASGVSVPLFSLPTLSSSLNIGVNLYGEKILIEILINPEKAHHDLEIINQLICDLHRWYLENIPLELLQPIVAVGRCQPRGFGQLCGCTCHLLPLDLYTEFVAPLDDQLLSVYPNGGMIHLCGEHTQHIPVWKKMRSLRAIQVNDKASEDLEIYFNELREDQIIYLNPTTTMTIERALEITGGKRLVIVAETSKSIKRRLSTLCHNYPPSWKMQMYHKQPCLSLSEPVGNLWRYVLSSMS